MGIASNRNSSSDKVRKELQSLNSKLSTSMSYLQVEDEISFLEKVPLGKINKYEARENHFDKVVKLWFKGLLLEHELIVSKGKIQKVDRDTAVKAYIKFADTLRAYLVELGILKFKSSGGGLKVQLESLYNNVFKSTDNNSDNSDEKDKKRKLYKNEKELDELMNNDNNLERDRLNRERREKDLKESKESSEKEYSNDSKEKGPTRERLNLDSDLSNDAPKEKAILGVDSRNNEFSKEVKTGASGEANAEPKEQTIYGKNAYMMMQGQINNLQTERLNLEMERQNMENLIKGNKDFFKELQDFKRENDKRFLSGKESEELDKKSLNNDKNKLSKEMKGEKSLDPNLKNKEGINKEKKEKTERGLKPEKDHLIKQEGKPKNFRDRIKDVTESIKNRVQNTLGINKNQESNRIKEAQQNFDKTFNKNQEKINELTKNNSELNKVDMKEYQENMRQAMQVREAMELQETDLSHYEKNFAEAMEIMNKEQKEPVIEQKPQEIEPFERTMRK